MRKVIWTNMNWIILLILHISWSFRKQHKNTHTHLDGLHQTTVDLNRAQSSFDQRTTKPSASWGPLWFSTVWGPRLARMTSEGKWTVIFQVCGDLYSPLLQFNSRGYILKPIINHHVSLEKPFVSHESPSHL